MSFKFIVYSTPTCPYCNMAKDLITEQGGHQNVATDAIVRLYQGVAPMFRALRDAVRGPVS